MSKLLFKHNPCETHYNVETGDDWCPICLTNERDALRARIKELEAANAWIPVSERLPEEGNLVIAIDKSGPFVGIYMAGAWGNNYFSSTNVTHWRPLPEAPKEGH